MTVTEQSVMLSCYPSGEILSARQKADNRLKGDVYESKAFRSEARSAEKKNCYCLSAVSATEAREKRFMKKQKTGTCIESKRCGNIK